MWYIWFFGCFSKIPNFVQDTCKYIQGQWSPGPHLIKDNGRPGHTSSRTMVGRATPHQEQWPSKGPALTPTPSSIFQWEPPKGQVIGTETYILYCSGQYVNIASEWLKCLPFWLTNHTCFKCTYCWYNVLQKNIAHIRCTTFYSSGVYRFCWNTTYFTGLLVVESWVSKIYFTVAPG
jgi:hypothetical protein